MLKLIQAAIQKTDVNTVVLDSVDYPLESISVIDSDNQIIKIDNKYINLNAVKEMQFRNNASILNVL